VLGHGLPNRLNPLDAGRRPSGVSDVEWAAMVTARRRDLIGALTETVLGRPLSPEPAQATEIGKTENAPADRHFEQTTLPSLGGSGPLLPEWFRKLFRRGP